MTEHATLSDRIRREAKVVGLRDFRTPTLEAVEHRRMQLWVLTTILLVAVSTAIAFLSMLPAASRDWLPPAGMRWGVVLLSAAFCLYAIEKEAHLHRLSRLLTDERVLTAALSNRLHEVSLLLDAGKAMNSVLELHAVLDVILRSASELLEGRSGSIMLVEADELVAACVRGNDAAVGSRLRVGQGIAGHVALTEEPLLINGHPDPEDFPGYEQHDEEVESAMCVPLVHRGRMLGVLNVNAEPARVFSEYDLRALSLFAEPAAGAIANARLYERERSHVAELVELDRLKTEFIDTVTHELRGPLTAVLAAAETAQRPKTRHMVDEMLPMIERNARNLAAMLEELLASVRLEQRRGLEPVVSVDLAEVARTIAHDFEASGRPVALDVPASAPVLGSEEGLRRVVSNLLDNAHKYGKPPVRVSVTPGDGSVALLVTDAGPGIPPESRERVFERFSRLEGAHGKPGLGLGLSIVRGLVVSFGGSVRVEDAPEGGTAVCVQVQAAVPAEVSS
ncbi:MAG TPA: GAF domain-containing sensor histidine kinase [Actinomycetota bacterium]